MPRPSRIAATMLAKLSSVSTMSDASRDFGARLTHADADVGFAKRRRVVHSVPGHGHDRPALLPGPHDPELVLGRGTRVYQLVGRFSGHDQAELTRDGQCGHRMVPGDHHGFHARAASPRNGLD